MTDLTEIINLPSPTHSFPLSRPLPFSPPELPDLQTRTLPYTRLGPHSRSQRAFTLIEVILAIGITIGLLLVAVYFYQQSAQLRSDLIDRTERLSEVQAAMERLTTDLRSVFASAENPFAGNATSLSFTAAATPAFPRSTAAPSNNPNAAGELPTERTATLTSAPSTDLHSIRYEALIHREGTNQSVEGLGRSEYFHIETSTAHAEANSRSSTSLSNNSTNSPPVAPLPVFSNAIRYVLFRYSDGRNWVDSWAGSTPPVGIEIRLGLESPPAEISSTEPSTPAPDGTDEFEYFRRVIFIPAAVITP